MLSILQADVCLFSPRWPIDEPALSSSKTIGEVQVNCQHKYMLRISTASSYFLRPPQTTDMRWLAVARFAHQYGLLGLSSGALCGRGGLQYHTTLSNPRYLPIRMFRCEVDCLSLRSGSGPQGAQAQEEAADEL
jgi:hypothetical protein